jgi:hypothetical protein
MSLPTRALGRTGMHLTRVSFGAWDVGGAGYRRGWGDQDDELTVAPIRRAIGLGVERPDMLQMHRLAGILARGAAAIEATEAGEGPARPADNR